MTRIIAICIDDEENVSGCLTNCLHAAENRMQRQQISRPVSDRSLQIPPCVLHWQDNHRAKLFRAMEADAPRLVAVHRQYAAGEHDETVSFEMHSAVQSCCSYFSLFDPIPKGSRTVTPVGSKSDTFRVTTVRPCSSAVAAIARSS